MSDSTSAPRANQLGEGTVTYEQVRVVVTPEAPYHYEVAVSETGDERAVHAVEYVAVNATDVRLEEPLWFTGADVDVGVPVEGHGDTAWIWP